VYNAEQMPPYLGDGLDSQHKTDNKVSGIKTNSTGGAGFNEWRFDDTKGKEQIFIHAQRNLDTRVKASSMTSVGGDYNLTVGGTDKDGNKGGDCKEKVYQDKHVHVLRHQVEQVEGNVQFTVGKGQADDGGNLDVVIEKDRKQLIGKNDHLHVQGAQSVQVDGTQDVTITHDRKELRKAASHLHVVGDHMEKVNGGMSLTVDGDYQEKTGQKHAVEAGMEIHLKAGMKVILEAGVQLTLKGPGGFVDIGPSGVTIQGTMVLINSGGAAGSGSGSKPTAPNDAQAPTDAQQAKPSDPASADDSKAGSKSAPG
jgi:type VI secretion system secreted protein VgrG